MFRPHRVLIMLAEALVSIFAISAHSEFDIPYVESLRTEGTVPLCWLSELVPGLVVVSQRTHWEDVIHLPRGIKSRYRCNHLLSSRNVVGFRFRIPAPFLLEGLSP